MSKSIFISGIDTDAGKSYVTGWLAKTLAESGKKAATMKFIQTGNTGRSEDIEVHRRIMGHSLPEDADLTTSPVIFTYPASPHLSAMIDRRPIDFEAIERSRALLESRYDIVLIEGAGGLMVPLSDDRLTIDYPVEHALPVILVTNGRLGSISHTILSLEAIASRGLQLDRVIYNRYFDNDKVIAPDTHRYIRQYLDRHFPGVEMVDCPVISNQD